MGAAPINLGGLGITYPTMVTPPDSTGYVVQYPNDIVSSGPLDGGASRSRVDVIGATGRVDVQWTCNPTRYNYIQAFFRTTIENGVDPFFVDLIYGMADIETHMVKFVPGTFQLASQMGQTYVLKASLEVYPLDVDTSGDQTTVALYSAYGDNASAVLDLLATFVNTQLNF